MRRSWRALVVGLGSATVAGCVQTAGIAPTSPADPESLIGQPVAMVLADLGEPEIRRREPPVEVWQYRTDACVFDVYFDETDEAESPVVVFYEARNREDGSAASLTCFREITAASRLPAAG